MSTTFETAKLCPKCERPGEDRRQQPVDTSRGPATMHYIYCVTVLCEWYGTPWLVQVNSDGSIPSAGSAFETGSKMFPKLSQETETRIQEMYVDQLRRETSGDPLQSEVRNPHDPR